MPASPRWVAPMSDGEWQELVRAALARLRKGLLVRLWNGLRAFAVHEELSLSERRRIERLPCSYELRLHTAQGKLKVRTLDLSLGGVAVHTDRPLKRGVPVRVEAPLAFNGLAMPRGRVRYSRPLERGFHTGIELDLRGVADSWVPEALRKLGMHAGHFTQRREHVRARGPLLTRLRNCRGETLYGTVLDISRGGALLRSSGSWDRGEPLWATAGPLQELPPLELVGNVLRARPSSRAGEWLVSVCFKSRPKLLDTYLREMLRV